MQFFVYCKQFEAHLIEFEDGESLQGWERVDLAQAFIMACYEWLEADLACNARIPRVTIGQFLEIAGCLPMGMSC